MKRFLKLLSCAAVCATLAIACDKYDDSALTDRVSKLEDRVSALEKTCQQINSDIVTLKQLVEALQNNDYVTNVTEVVKDGKVVGYTLTFSKRDPVTIYHGENGKDGANGKDGKDGQDGKDGYTPQIGVRQDSDGIWYWTLDGEWLLDSNGNKIKAVGTDGRDGIDGQNGKDGNDGKDGKDGQNGQDGKPGSDGKDGLNGADGQNGADGKDGVTPQLKIEDGYWLISYDNGQTWSVLGKATGDNGRDGVDGTNGADGKDGKDGQNGQDGKDGKDGKDGDSMFRSVSQDSDFVYLVLVDGTEISVPKTPKISIRLSVDPSEVFVSDGQVITVQYELQNAAPNPIVTASSDGIYTVRISRTDALRGTLTIQAPNPVEDGYVNLIATDDSGRTAISVINFTEGGIKFAGGLTYYASSDAQTINIPFQTSYRYKAEPAAGCTSWLSVSPATKAMHDETLAVKMTENTATENRTGKINIYNADNDEFLCQIEVVQETNIYNAMIFKVKAYFANDYTVVLPLGLQNSWWSDGEVDCTVDWGDGTVEHVTELRPSHKYDANTATEFTVSISGKMTHINSEDLDSHSVVEVVQWGKTGLKQMNHAFAGNKLLRKICDDTAGSFKNLETTDNAYNGCSSLTEIPEGLFSHASSCKDFSHVFDGCTSITSIPDGLFRECASAKDFSYVFNECNSISVIGEDIFANCSLVEDFSWAFCLCSSLINIPSDLFENCINMKKASSIFFLCKSISEIPTGLFDNCSNLVDLYSAFYGCESLEYVPYDLFDNCPRLNNVRQTFANCKLLCDESPYTIVNGNKVHLYERCNYPDIFIAPDGLSCFFKCYGLTDYDQIPSSWK